MRDATDSDRARAEGFNVVALLQNAFSALLIERTRVAELPEGRSRSSYLGRLDRAIVRKAEQIDRQGSDAVICMHDTIKRLPPHGRMR